MKQKADTITTNIKYIQNTLAALSGKWKLGQNRTAGDRRGLAQGLEQSADEGARELGAMLAAREPAQDQ